MEISMTPPNTPCSFLNTGSVWHWHSLYMPLISPVCLKTAESSKQKCSKHWFNFVIFFKWTFDKIHWEYVHGKQKLSVCISRLWFFIFGFNCNNQQAVWSPNSLQHTHTFICTNLFQTNFVNQIWINGTRTNDVHNSNAQPHVQRNLTESSGMSVGLCRTFNVYLLRLHSDHKSCD